MKAQQKEVGRAGRARAWMGARQRVTPHDISTWSKIVNTVDR